MTAPLRSSSAIAPMVSHDDVERVTRLTGDPAWMRELRHCALDAFLMRPLPSWSGDLGALAIGTRDAAPEALSDVRAPELPDAVIMEPLVRATRTHEALVREAFGTLVPPADNPLAALATAMWTGGWLVFVPPGVDVAEPIALPRSGALSPAGRFERSLVVVGEGARVRIREHTHGEDLSVGAIHGAVTELIVRRGARCRFTTTQQLPAHACHLATRRAVADPEAVVRWDDVHLGARLAMQYPSVYLRGAGAAGEIVSGAIAGAGQHHDVGAKLVFEAPECRGRALIRAVSLANGRTTRRTLVKVARGARRAVCQVDDRSLGVGSTATCEAHPYIEIDERDARVSRDSATARPKLAAPDAPAPPGLEPPIAFLRPLLDALDSEAAHLVEEAVR